MNYIHTQGFHELASRNRIWRVLVNRVLGGATLTVCLGPALVDDVRSRVQGDLICIPNTSAGSGLLPATAHADGSKRVVFLSNLIPSKGADTFVDAAIELSSRIKNVEFLILGADTDADFSEMLRSKVRESDYRGRIHFYGATYGSQKWDVLDAATLLAYPSKYDAQPLSIIEALSCGVPVVAYNTGGIRDLVASGVNGFLVDQENFDQFVDRCAAIIEDDVLRRQLGDAARYSFEQNYSEAAYKAAWEKAIRTLEPGSL